MRLKILKVLKIKLQDIFHKKLSLASSAGCLDNSGYKEKLTKLFWSQYGTRWSFQRFYSLRGFLMLSVGPPICSSRFLLGPPNPCCLLFSFSPKHSPKTTVFFWRNLSIRLWSVGTAATFLLPACFTFLPETCWCPPPPPWTSPTPPFRG